MNKKELIKHCQREVEIADRIQRFDKHYLEHKLVLNIIEENQQLKEQQKEFIEYLEEPIRMFEQGNQINISEYTSAKLDTLEEVLSKYKEIIGDKE